MSAEKSHFPPEHLPQFAKCVYSHIVPFIISSLAGLKFRERQAVWVSVRHYSLGAMQTFDRQLSVE